MANPDKPNTEVDDPMDMPSTENLASGSAERAVMGTSGPNGMVRIALAILIFIVACGTMFYFLNN